MEPNFRVGQYVLENRMDSEAIPCGRIGDLAMNETIISWAIHTLNWVDGSSKPAGVPREILKLIESAAKAVAA